VVVPVPELLPESPSLPESLPLPEPLDPSPVLVSSEGPESDVVSPPHVHALVSVGCALHSQPGSTLHAGLHPSPGFQLPSSQP
jgi:hypothetical protein